MAKSSETFYAEHREEVLTPSTESAVFRIEGLEATGGPNEFVLHGVKRLEIAWERIEEKLTEAGLERVEAQVLTEDFAGRVQKHVWAKALAERMERVG